MGRRKALSSKHRKMGFGNESDTNADSLCPLTLRLGYDSFQVLQGDSGMFELVVCADKCGTSTIRDACPPLELRTGLRNDLPCTCDSRMWTMNCGNRIVPDGKSNVCKQDWGRCLAGNCGHP